ncbi:AAA family ATPase [Phaeodactylibacter luteus]|uniref:AAA family ATPase n=2 Tax=Phaeodactylibacter luteus TaxID=1564516 RepID=A0A5C6S547_9BACT|nr:AAA family ATPase [Phaeodactylibacter luteus]
MPMTERINKPELAKLFYAELRKVLANGQLPPAGVSASLYRLMTLLFVELTQAERLQFSTLFARIAYVCHRDEVDRKLQFFVHVFRKGALRAMRASEEEVKAVNELGTKVLFDLIEALLEEPMPEPLRAFYPPSWPANLKPYQVAAFLPRARVVILEDDEAAEQFLAKDEEHAYQVVRVQYNEAGRNDNFSDTIDSIRAVFGLPVVMNLLDIEVDEQGVYHPRAMVIEPDYLVDVTAVADCFQASGTNPWPFLLKKYMPKEPSPNLMLGNIANFFLDELMNNPALDFRAAFAQTFRQNPLQFCLFDDKVVREIMQKSQRHFLTLKQMVANGFQEQGITPEECYLEPSFYSEAYGLQGRLDVLHMGPERANIVELKSGKPFMPNIYGLSPNHFTQTLLYDLMVRSAFGKEVNPANYILYSGQEEQQLRYAPRISAQQTDALQVRNHLVGIERLLAELGNPEKGGLEEQGNRLFGKLSPQRHPELKGFHRRDMEAFEKIYRGMSPVARSYFIAFSGLIAREHRLAKAGEQGMDNVNGMASLWLNSFEEKEAGFDIISHLRVTKIRAQEAEPIVEFQKTAHTNPLANFRIGDIAVLYPHQEGQSVLSNQVFKCSVVEISNSEVWVRLRCKQFNSRIFTEYADWNLEHDLLDSSFNSMYQGLYTFAGAPKDKQALLLTQRAPREGEAAEIPVPEELTAEQQDIYRRALSAEDYFLLWGPPGTGKTSMMLKHLVSYLFEETEENILLLAYTNRAVDEICDSIERIRQDIRAHYFRIGSRYGTAPRFQPQLLNEKISKASTRKELLQVIHRHRIVVGTVSSVSGRTELLKLKHFDRVIIDEASQILEPALVGLLPQFERFILIGDHNQLPAVVVQKPGLSAVSDEPLRQLGLYNLRNSLFERLFKRCQENGWHWAYAQLSHQGRMHEDIMAFPNQYFYNNTLKILPEEVPAAQKQVRPLALPVAEGDPLLLQRLGQDRLLFLDTPPDDRSATQKTNAHEAEQAASLVKAFQELYQRKGWPLTSGSIGIITPYRAQIAQIQSVLEASKAPVDLLTVDTVERYQGGARDIIILSLCTNSLSQLAALSSMSEEGVDRKLNVALTRARHHIVILGNRELLSRSDIYRSLLKFCDEKTLEP